MLGCASHEEFSLKIEGPSATVRSWFGGRPSVPSTAYVLRLAAHGVSPTWLLLGEGPDFRASAQSSDLGAVLCAYLVSALAAKLDESPAFLSAVLPTPAKLLDETVAHYRSKAEREVAEKRALAFRQKSPLAVALAARESKDLESREDARLAALPPVSEAAPKEGPLAAALAALTARRPESAGKGKRGKR